MALAGNCLSHNPTGKLKTMMVLLSGLYCEQSGITAEHAIRKSDRVNGWCLPAIRLRC